MKVIFFLNSPIVIMQNIVGKCLKHQRQQLTSSFVLGSRKSFSCTPLLLKMEGLTKPEASDSSP